jgi:DNA-binding LytR/AlgR family response regulator
MKEHKVSIKKKSSIVKAKPAAKRKIAEKVILKYIFNDGKIVVKSGNMMHVLWYRNIISIVINEKLSNTLRIHCVDRKDVIVKLPLKWFEKRLVYPDFIRTHVSCIANMFHAQYFERLKDKGFLYLTKDIKAEVSKEHFDEVEKSLNNGADIVDTDILDVGE